MSERAFAAIPLNARSTKPRSRGLTEIRGPYYSVMGRRYLGDILDTMHLYVDGAEIRRRVLRVDAAGQSRRDHRSRPPPRRLCLDRRVDRERAALWCRGGRKIPRGSEDSRLRRDRTLDRFHYDSRRRSAAADTAGGKKLGSRPSRSLGSSSVPAVVQRRSRSWRQRARATLGG